MPKVKNQPKEDSPLATFRKILGAVEKPEKEMPTMVLRISELSSDDLGNMISRYSAWREFVEDKLIAASAEATSLREKYQAKYNAVYMGVEGRTINDKKILTESNADVEKLDKEATDAEIMRDLFSGKLDSLSNAISTLSRELTRRGIISNS